MRTSEELFAEAELEEQQGPKKEPWVLLLKNGTRVTFRHPQDAPLFDPSSGLQGQINALIEDNAQRREFWKEWGGQKSRRIINLLNAVTDYYVDEAGEEGKGGSAT